MLAEIVILLGLANIVLVYLIMRKLKEIAYPTSTKRRKQDDEEEEDEEEDAESKEDKKESKEKDEVKEAKEKLAKMNEEEEQERKSSKKSKSKLGGLFSKKEPKEKPHLSEMPDMNRVIEELQAEFAQKAAGAAAPISKKTGNEIKDRLDEIERM